MYHYFHLFDYHSYLRYINKFTQMQRESQAVDTQSNNLLNQGDLADSYDWRQEENQKAQYKNPKIKDLFPVNYNSEMERFFQQHCQYNPHFCYKTIVAPELITLHTQYEEYAHKILINNKFERPILPILTQEQVVKEVEEYLQKLGLGEYVEIKFQSNCLSRTSVAFYKEKAVLKIRTPLEYNHLNLEGVLNHEIGTHIVRRLNHKQNCVRKPSQRGRLIEQGLAAINQLLTQQQPFLFKAALRYAAAIYASKMTFSQVYKHLNKYLKDEKDCWRETVRVKRGIGSTQQHGGYYKDQNYFIGAIEILRDRKDIDFRKIFYGKLAPNETINLKSGVLPPFIDNQEKYRSYLKKLDAMAICNFID